MRGGLERWKRGAESQGVRQAISYALKGTCDSHLRVTSGAEALAAYSDADGDGGGDSAGICRFMVEDGTITTDRLDSAQLRLWVDGRDPETGEQRGRDLSSPKADLLLDGTINAPKSYSVAALIHPELAVEFEALQDRLRDRIITIWQSELNARRGAGGRIRERLHRVEVVELQHRRSRALDPHIHRHLWLNVKVQGVDGQWSNVDSRVAMKLHTVINAEGDLAARTDPEWVAALARHGYTLNEDGEITELAHVVRPLSRRSTQIEANRALLLTRWRDEHPGEHPSPDVVHQIDRWAWAKGRPNKPGDLDEAAWEQLVRDELVGIDARILDPRRAVTPTVGGLGSVDRELLATMAIVEADARSTSSGGRFSVMDVRAGVLRAIAGSGLVQDRNSFTELIDHVIAVALDSTIDLLDGEVDRPDHIKGYMSVATAALKVDLAARFDALSREGECAEVADVADAASRCVDSGVTLDADQVAAACAIAGTDVLVSVTGPAGAGKTTMLRVAKEVLRGQERQMVVVAPTKKAASVAGREIGTTASSLHALLADHGWRWAHDPATGDTWTRLVPGDPDPNRGDTIYPGPRRYVLRSGDRIVVDEAGMVDLQTANALAEVAADTGAGIAMVGDPLQAMPVGHRGAMATLTSGATAVVELTSVHRFRDPDYAALTLRMREPATVDDAVDIANVLHDRGQVRHVADAAAARDAMVDAYFRHTGPRERVALVTGTNEDADAINEAIQERRVAAGELATSRIAVGAGEQRLLEGDVVQTRRNDSASDVENRALWTIGRIHHDRIDLAGVGDSTHRRTVDAGYVAEHVHLAYASTVHGIQGETTTASTVGPGVDASGFYVGMTRGRIHNEAIVIAPNPVQAVEKIAETMLRGRPETTIEDSRNAARTDLHRAARDEGGEVESDALRASTDPALQGSRGSLLSAAGELRAWIAKTERGLLVVDARVAANAAATHGRGAPGGDEREPSGRTRVVALLNARQHDLDMLTEQLATGPDPGPSRGTHPASPNEPDPQRPVHAAPAAANGSPHVLR